MLLLGFAILAVGCYRVGVPLDAPDGGDADADADSDIDTDVDSDSDADTDTSPSDADGDWLSDEFEAEYGTDPNDDDTDDDGVSDLVELVMGTDPTDPESNPAANGWLSFLVPYEQVPEPPEDAFVFSTDLGKADLFLLMDTTGSMSGAINILKDDLTDEIIPAIEAIIPDVWFAVGGFEDYPVSPYGSGADLPFYLLTRTTPFPGVAQAAVNDLDATGGGDGPESQLPALWAAATGAALGDCVPAQTECEDGEVGYPCFRPDALPVVMLITDASFHGAYDDFEPYEGIDPEPPDWGEAATALNAIHAKVLGIWIENDDTWEGEEHCQQIAWDTNAITADDDPLAFSINAGGLGDSMVEAVEWLTSQVPLERIEALPRDDEEADTVDTVAAFLDRIEPDSEGGVEDPQHPGVFCVGGLPTVDDDDDDVPDAFEDVLPGTSICFDVVPKVNATVPHGDQPQVFPMLVDVVGDEVTVLDTRHVFFVVPPQEPLE